MNRKNSIRKSPRSQFNWHGGNMFDSSLRKTPLEINNRNRRNRLFLSSASYKQKQNGVHMYGRPLRKGPSMNGFNSRNAFKRKPGSTKHDPTSPAAMSYNMAMDFYHPLESRQGNSRAAIVTSGIRVRPGSMKRTVSGWTHNIGFLSKINGHKTGAKDPKT